jgi:Tol biopolymer transport system component
MKKIAIVLIASMVIVVGFLSGCETKQNGNQNGNQTNGSQYEIPIKGKIAFSSEPTTYSGGSIHIINPNGTNEIIITNEGVLPIRSWSPDGKKIAYYEVDGIYLINSDGTGKFQILNKSKPFSWLPDGKILFTETGSNGGVYTANSDGSNWRKLIENESCADVTCSPDGLKIIYQGATEGENYRIYVMNNDGTNKITVYEGQMTKTIACSSDGQKISYRLSDDTLYIMNIDGSNKIELSDNVRWSSWSPDGEKIAYSPLIGNGDEGASLYISNPDGTGLVSLLRGVKLTQQHYIPHSWSPDGKKIVYNLDENIYIIDIDGSNQTQLAIGYYPQWSQE